MRVRTALEIGLLVRDRRKHLQISQAELAERVGASRQWIAMLESGKPRLELALTLRALSALGLQIDVIADA